MAQVFLAFCAARQHLKSCRGLNAMWPWALILVSVVASYVVPDTKGSALQPDISLPRALPKILVQQPKAKGIPAGQPLLHWMQTSLCKIMSLEKVRLIA